MKTTDSNKTNVIPFGGANNKSNGLMMALNRVRKSNPKLAPAPAGYDNIEAFEPEDIAAAKQLSERPTGVTFRSTRRDR